MSSLLAKHADNIFFPNVRELLKILAVLPMGSMEAERSFSSIRIRIHTWLRNIVTMERLSDRKIVRGVKCPWLTGETKKLMNQRKARRSGAEVDWNAYR